MSDEKVKADDPGSVEGPYVNVTCGGCGTCETFEILDIVVGGVEFHVTRCLEGTDWDYSGDRVVGTERVLCPDCQES